MPSDTEKDRDGTPITQEEDSDDDEHREFGASILTKLLQPPKPFIENYHTLAADTEAFDWLFKHSDSSLQIGKQGTIIPIRNVHTKQAIIFRLEIPPTWESAEILLFQQDASGTICLISTPEVMNHDLRFSDVAEVPRQNASADGTRPLKRLEFTEPEQSRFVAVLSCNRNYPVHFHHVFQHFREDPGIQGLPHQYDENLGGLLAQLKDHLTFDPKHTRIAAVTINAISQQSDNARQSGSSKPGSGRSHCEDPQSSPATALSEPQKRQLYTTEETGHV